MNNNPTGASIRLENLSRTYGEGPTAVHALRGASLDVSPGQFVVILGPSGSGKTTLLNLIGSIDEPTSGSVRVGGIDLGSLDDGGRIDYRRTNVGFIFQFFNLIPTLTAGENVELIAELTGSHGLERAGQVLELVGLGDRIDHFPSQLSGGEQQRVAIARALAKEPPVLLCDEPTGELDFETGRRILGLLHRLNRETGRTVLLVTHNASVGEMADRVLRLHSGEIVSDTLNDAPVDAEELYW
ncbi:MAG: ABC transporter ATP-binding protein [Acidimicrobiia bacterium]|nr:ABC transporter ATP-binding protein [Acidimicrobiia bacterium]MDH3397352.1 ABC transporter ATP-binding protein [Acidimicrobiia bacterium]MDH5616555.1 ABC transporter ATP-binding protein [Acidimicrobiia bacterium]